MEPSDPQNHPHGQLPGGSGQSRELHVQGTALHAASYGLLCGCAVVLEASALAAALSDRMNPMGPALALLVHGLACGLGAVALAGLLPQQPQRWSGFLFLFAVAFYMPLFGMLGVIGCFIAERRGARQQQQEQPWLSIGLPELPHQPPVIAARPEYGDGALSAMLRYCKNPERRLAAVLAARQLHDQNDTEVLRVALTDKVDDVRLLAYSLLDRREQAFNARLRSLLGQLESVPADQHPKLRKRLAQTQLEMIHLGLARGEVQRYLLAEARRHIATALSGAPDDCEGLFLLGSIALRQDDLAVAEQAYAKAQALGMAAEKVMPYLAEVAFRQRRFSLVSQRLRTIDPFYFHTQPLLSSIAAHWIPEEDPCRPQ